MGEAVRAAAGDADWLSGAAGRASESEALLALLGAVAALWVEFPETGAAALFAFDAGAPVSLCAELRKLPGAAGRTSGAEVLLELFGAVTVLWVEFPETGAVVLFAFEAGAPVSLCAELRKLPGAAGRVSEAEGLLALLGAVAALWVEFPKTGATALFAFEVGVPVSLWRLSEDARRGVRSVGTAPEFVPVSAVLDAAERELGKADELPRFTATRRAEAPGASALWGVRAALAFCSAGVSDFF